MLYRVQKEVLALFFVIVTVYPAYSVYRLYRRHLKNAVKNTETLSKGLLDNLMIDTSRQKEPVDTFKFNLNEVSWEALTLIPGIGKTTARKIITYRLKNGKFKSVEDVMKIKGIGRKTYEKLKPFVYVR